MVSTDLSHKERTGDIMKMKPKSTTKNPKALLYKRFIGLERSENVQSIYMTVSDGKFWAFDNSLLEFSTLEQDMLADSTQIIQITNLLSVLKYKETYFRYNGNEWETITDISASNIEVLNARFNNVARYQTNRYYFVGSFDYVIKGSIDSGTAQYIKGNIIPMRSLSIKHYDDDIKISPDDLVVIENHLYSVESPDVTYKQQPKPFKIYTATLNNIL